MNTEKGQPEVKQIFANICSHTISKGKFLIVDNFSERSDRYKLKLLWKAYIDLIFCIIYLYTCTYVAILRSNKVLSSLSQNYQA